MATIIDRTPWFLRPGFGTSYRVYSRLWGIVAKRGLFKGLRDWNELGTLISPRGDSWRLCGRGDAGGPRLLKPETNTFRDVNYATLLRALLLGWTIVNDSDKMHERRYTISRWPDGSHFYVRNDQGEDVTDGQKVKWDTWHEADRAGRRWVARQLVHSVTHP